MSLGKVFSVNLLVVSCALTAAAQTPSRLIKVAVIDFGESALGRLTADRVAAKLSTEDFEIVDRDGTRLAARGAGYRGSLNLSVKEARDLGAAVGCDFYLIGDAQTLRRSRFNLPIYFEAYASIFLVSSRSGKLLMWQRPSFEAASADVAEQNLLKTVGGDDLSRDYLAAILEANTRERRQRELNVEGVPLLIEAAPEDEKAAEALGIRLPRPYRRLRPTYPESAARADAEAVVDVLIDLDLHGEISRLELARWAGFGLDEASLDAARQLHFFPAMRDGIPVPIRILLRYNFRKSAK